MTARDRPRPGGKTPRPALSPIPFLSTKPGPPLATIPIILARSGTGVEGFRGIRPAERSAPEIDVERARAVGTDHERLLDVGGLRGARDEAAVVRGGGVDAPIGGVEVADERLARDDEDHAFGEERGAALGLVARHPPDRAALRHGGAARDRDCAGL